ncbi:hypothetical protein [Halogeometricum borinquense]|nr:hypothetical protein [Halogeometricum borinquense]
MSQKTHTRRKFLYRTGAAICSISTLPVVTAESNESEYDVPIRQVRKLLWQHKIDEAKAFMDKHNMKYHMARGVPSFKEGDVSTDRYGSPSEDNKTDLWLSLNEIEEGNPEKNIPPVYDATISWNLSEWNNDAGDFTQKVGSKDSAAISWSQDYWQAVDESRENVKYENDRIEYEEMKGLE